MEKRLIPMQEISLDDVTALSQAVAAQQQSNEQMASMIGKMAELVFVMDGWIKAMESLLQQRVTVTSAQAGQIAAAVRDRASQICSKNALPYDKCGRIFRDAIWRAFKSQYTVASHYDLPAVYADHALSFIEGWTSFALIRRARERLDE